MKRWTPLHLLLSRIARFWREQFKIWKTALDWTVLLYIAVPGLWILGGLWFEMLREPPEWLLALPPEVAPAIFVILLFAGRLRTFLEDADVLILLQRRGWIRTLKLGGAVYTLIAHAVSTALLFALLLPWLRLHDAFDAAGLVMWAVLTAVSRSFAAACYRLAASLLRGWKRWAAYVVIACLLAAFYAASVMAADGSVTALAACAATAFAGWAAAVCVLGQLRSGFEADLQGELRARTASAALLLAAANIEQKPAPLRNRPFLFPNSGRILRASDPGAVLAEMRIKSFLRQSRQLGHGFRVIAIPTFALLAVPGWVSIILAVVLTALVASWLRRDFREWMDEPFIARLPWEEKAIRRGASLSRFRLMLPAAVWYAGVAGWQFAGWAGLLPAVPLGVCLLVLIHSMMDDWPVTRRRPAGPAAEPSDRETTEP